MPGIDIIKTIDIVRSPRVVQCEGLFDVPLSEKATLEIKAELPIENFDWNIGLVYGPSGSGKTTIANEIFPANLIKEHEWPGDKSILDGFPEGISIKTITGALNSVGFSSPPSWMKPYHVLSNGEKFRVTLARAIVESSEQFVIDEFTSVVDRTVAKIGSSAVAKAIRKHGRKMIALSCHDDIIDWLCPDWTFNTATRIFQRRSLRRPPINVEIRRVDKTAWRLFSKHHYLSSDIHPGAKCFCGFIDGHPVAFSSVIIFPHPRFKAWREHRTVVIPDYQGVGIGNAMSEYVAGLFRATGKQFVSTTSNPAMIYHRAKSRSWIMHRAPSRVSVNSDSSSFRSHSTNRITAGFKYVGPPNHDDAKRFGII
jgi:ABC-type lipoprotein export system ATPase subunit